jgi:CubicO group peptidase (beta-lactamase class C family)
MLGGSRWDAGRIMCIGRVDPATESNRPRGDHQGTMLSRTMKLQFILMLLLTLMPPCIPARVQADDDRYEKKLQPLLEAFIREQQIPGLSIAIVEANRVVYAKGFGWKSLDRRKGSVTPLTVFHMASIVKPFVATAILQLVEHNKIDLDGPVVHYLPYFRLDDERYKIITVRQMVAHTSGMPDVVDYEWNKPQFDDGALERYVRSLGDLHLLREPGSKFSYSNIAYDVLGDVVAKASGSSFEDYVQQHILTPLGMKNSTLLYRDVDPSLLSDGHVLNSRGNPIVSEAYPYNRIHSPSSNLHSNAIDMTRWAIANMNHGELNGKRILNASTYSSMWRPSEDIGDAATGTSVTAEGISWYLGTYRGHPFVTHSGGDLGFITDLAMLPDQRIAVVWMANCDWIDSGPLNGPITYAALDVALGLQPQPITLKRSLKRTLSFTFQREGFAAALREYQMLRLQHRDLYDSSDKQLSDFGAQLLDADHTQEAIEILSLNVKAHPSSAYAHMQLAQAYMADGNRPLAVIHYARAVKLDPTLAGAATGVPKP